MANQTTSPKNKSKILFILTGLLLSVLIGLIFLPHLMSTEWAKNKAKQVVNARIPGIIDFKKISLSWFNGIQLQGFIYDNRDNGIVVTIADVTTSKGILAIATHHKEIGAITIKEPVTSIYLREQPASQKAGTNSSSKNGESSTTAIASVDASKQRTDNQPEGSRPTPFPAIEGQLIITGGTVIAVFPDSSEKRVLQDLEIELKISGQEHLLDYLVTFQSGDSTGKVKAVGTVTLPMEDISRLEEIQSQAELDIDSWEITDLLSILATTADLPTGSGQLDGHISVSGRPDKGLQVKGSLTAQQINLHGGLLKSDTPYLEKVDIEIDVEKTGSTLALNGLTLISPLVSGEISAAIDSQNKKEIVSKATVDLAQVFAQFPDTLNLKPGIKISTGTIDIDAKVTATDMATLFDGSTRLDKLEGIADKKKLAWDKPVTVVAKGELGPEGLRLENFEVQSSFVNGKGQGDINQMQVQLAADIGAALNEIQKFIDLKDWKSSGKMDLNLQVGTKTEVLRSVEGNVSIKDFMVQQKDRLIAPHHSFSAKLTTNLRLDQKFRPQEILDTVLDFQSWIGRGNITLKNLIPGSDQTIMQVKDLGLKGNFGMGDMSTLLQALDILPKDIRFSGEADINTKLAINDDKIVLGDTTIETKDFLFQNAKQQFGQKKIHLTTRGFVNLKDKTALLKPVDIITTTGHIVLPELIITNWSQLENSIKTNGSIDLDLGLLATLLSDLLKLPPDNSIAGQATIKLGIDLTDAQHQLVNLNGNLAAVKMMSKGRTLLSEKNIKIILDLIRDTGNQTFTLSNLEFSTEPISLNASGKVTPDKNEYLLTTEGSITLNLKALSDYLKSLADVELEMTGKAKRPFTFQAKSVNGNWVEIPKHAELSASFHAESIRGFGLHIESLEIPIRLVNSSGEIDIQGIVNRGKMALVAAIDFTVDPPVISIPANATVLTGVGLSEDLSNDLLAKIHPLFKGAAVSQGTVDLGVQNFAWPLDAAARKDAAFAGSLTFNKVKLQAGGLLAPLLAVMKVDEREITLSNQPMEFVGENGRVRCSPLEITIKEYSLKLSGSIGFDQSLDYIAQIPVTRKMVGGDVYKYLEGTFITVPIGGTVSKPSVSKDLVQTALKDLVMKAGKKQITDQAGKLLQKLFQ